MSRGGLVITIIVAVLALGCGFGSAAAIIGITQPSVAGSTTVVQFTVESGDSTAAVAQRLQQQGLIRNAQLFRVWARYKHLDTGIEPGVYDLTASMTMDAIIKKLQQGTPDQIVAHVIDGWRVEQYPDAFKDLANFNKANFLKIVKTGKLNDGTLLSKSFWYVLPPQKNAVNALEGYLYPDTYFFDTKATEEDVVKRMLATLGERLCPGPAGQPDAYLADQTQCEANAAKIGSTDVFKAMKSAYFTNDSRFALYDTLTLASLTAREILHYKDAPGVAAVYYNRYLSFLGKKPSDTAGYMGSDPSAQYARDTDTPPKQDGKYWTDLADKGANIDPKSPYNTDNINDTAHRGLPPGPIAAPLWDEIVAAAVPAKSDFFYFASNKCGTIFYAKTNDEFNAQVVPQIDRPC